MIFLIKHGGVWKDGKLVPTGGRVDLEPADRELIDPNHTDLESAEEAEIASQKLDVEASLARRKSQALARIDAEHAEKLKRDAERAKAEEEKKKNHQGGGA